MKLIKIVLIVLLGITTCYANDNLNSIAAVVNNDIITELQVDNAVKQAQMQLQAGGQTVASGSLRKQVLDQLINLSLQLQMAKTAGLTVSDDQVTKAIEDIAKRNNFTIDQLQAQLKAAGMDYSAYRQNIHDQILASEIRNQALQSDIKLTPEDFARFKASYNKDLNKQKLYDVEDVLVPYPSDNPSSDQVAATKAKAVALLKLLDAGKTPDFSQYGATITDLGASAIADLPDAFAPVVVKLAKDAWSMPIQTNNGYHLITVKEIKSAGESLSDAQLQTALFQKKYEEAATKWFQKLRSQSYIKIGSQ